MKIQTKAHVYCSYLRQLHELHLWFSNIREVEREISLRTEAGLYYSYYKQLIFTPNFSKGIHDLKVDNITEHGRSINILQRFNIHQEVALAYLYRTIDLRDTIQPILFYVYACFAWCGVGVTALFFLSWYLCSTWTAGFLTVVWYITNLDDSTRAFFTVNLREHFAFPFLWLQFLVICVLLHPKSRSFCAHFTLLAAFVTFSFLFSLMWQFNQFVFLLQALSLYTLRLFKLCPKWKIQCLLFMQIVALLLVWYVQYYQMMLLGAFVLAFNTVAIVSLQLFNSTCVSGGLIFGPFKVISECSFTLVVSAILNIAIKSSLNILADEHIWTFVKVRFNAMLFH